MKLSIDNGEILRFYLETIREWTDDSINEITGTKPIELRNKCVLNSIGIYCRFKLKFSNEIKLKIGSVVVDGIKLFHVWTVVNVKGMDYIYDITSIYNFKNCVFDMPITEDYEEGVTGFHYIGNGKFKKSKDYSYWIKNITEELRNFKIEMF